MTKKLRTFFVLFGTILSMNAQCGPSYADNASPRSVNDSVGISFTTDATCAGILTSIAIDEFNSFIGPVTNVVVRLYAGNGTGGSVLGELTGVNLASNNTFDFSAQNIVMVASTQYTVIVDVTGSAFSVGIQYGFNTAFNSYTGGSLFDDGVEMPGLHIDFAVSIDNSTLSVNDVDANNTKVRAYPNPATNSIQLTSLKQQENYSILDIYGRKVLEGTVKGNETIHIQQLNKGIYFVQLEKRVLKFIKK